MDSKEPFALAFAYYWHCWEDAMKRKKYDSLKDIYPEYISLDQMYQICGIAKRSALYLIKSGIVPAEDTGKRK